MSTNDQDNEQNWVVGIILTLTILLAIGIALMAPFALNSISKSGHMSSSPTARSTGVEQQHKFSLGTLDMAYTGGVLTLTGKVPDEDSKHRILSKAQAIFGADKVKDQIEVVPGSTALWWKARPLDIFARLRQFSEFWLTLDGHVLKFRGKVNNEDNKSFIVEWLKANFVDGVDVNTADLVVDSAVTQSAYDPSVLLNETIEFETGQAQIPVNAEKRLELIASVLKDDGRAIKIMGHTDNTGDAQANQELSQKRAESVVAFLVMHGVPADKLAAEGMGQNKPIGDNATEEGRQQNRRIEFVAVQ